ncbi:MULTISPECIES: hypothetical protein [unclassified Chitinophaga]
MKKEQQKENQAINNKAFTKDCTALLSAIADALYAVGDAYSVRT